MAKRAANNSRRQAHRIISFAESGAFLTFKKVFLANRNYISVQTFWSRNRIIVCISSSFSSNMVLLGCAAASSRFGASFCWFFKIVLKVSEKVCVSRFAKFSSFPKQLIIADHLIPHRFIDSSDSSLKRFWSLRTCSPSFRNFQMFTEFD